MKRLILTSAMMIAGMSLLAADAKDELIGAVKKLSAAPNLTWKKTVENAGGGPGSGWTDGKAQKDGCMLITFVRGDTSLHVVLKGDKGAILAEDKWLSFAEAAFGEQGPVSIMARTAKAIKRPAAEAEAILGLVDKISKSDGVFSGEASEDGAKTLIASGGSLSSDASKFRPEIADPKALVKFWVKDGVLTKYQYKLSGKMKLRDREIKVDRITTIEIKDIGTTKVEVPAEAMKKLDS